MSYLGRLYLDMLATGYRETVEILAARIGPETRCLDLGCGDLKLYDALREAAPLEHYLGLDYHTPSIRAATERGVPALRVDFDRDPLPEEAHGADLAWSVHNLEHLVRPCRFLDGVFEALAPGGHLLVATPNLAAWFNVAHLVLGLPPSTGPHPDREALRRKAALWAYVVPGFHDVEAEETPSRHLVVHTWRSLRAILRDTGFEIVDQRAYGYHPFPPALSRLLCRLDPWHAHHMTFLCRKPGRQRASASETEGRAANHLS